MTEPLVLLPGLICDATVWRAQLGYFSVDRDVIVVDHGTADSLTEMADCAIAQAGP